MQSHPEADSDNTIEPTVGEQLRLVEFNRKLESLGREELLDISKTLAKQTLVTQPSVIRWLAHEAARNLAGQTKDWSEEVKQLRNALSDVSGEH
jgi:hypothetical protein